MTERGRFYVMDSSLLPQAVFQVVEITKFENTETGSLIKPENLKVLYQSSGNSADQLFGMGIVKQKRDEGKDVGIIFNNTETVVFPEGFEIDD